MIQGRWISKMLVFWKNFEDLILESMFSILQNSENTTNIFSSYKSHNFGEFIWISFDFRLQPASSVHLYKYFWWYTLGKMFVLFSEFCYVENIHSRNQIFKILPKYKHFGCLAPLFQYLKCTFCMNFDAQYFTRCWARTDKKW